MDMRRTLTAATAAALMAASFATTVGGQAAPPTLIAMGSISGLYEDFATDTRARLENGVPGNRLGGIGSALAYAGGDTFLALPDRGPNAVAFNPCTDDTVSYINRFQTLHMSLSPSDAGSPLPFTLTPMLVDTTLLSSRQRLHYGQGCGAVADGAPALNHEDHTHYFTGRSDNFDGGTSTNPFNGRFDPEGLRVSNDGRSVYISDEYGPYVYEFDRETGRRTRVFTLPAKFAVPNMNAEGAVEIAGNVTGRVTNKGMEGLAITPDGRTLVGAMQSPLIQDGGDFAGGVARIVTIDIRTGVTHEYAYQLDVPGSTKKTTISEILAINDTDFLVDERDSKGLGDNSVASFKRLYRISLTGAFDISNLSGQANIAPKAVGKTLFLNIVTALTGFGLNAADIPAKLEGISFGQDVTIGGVTKHTLYVANDNDFLATAPNSTTGNTSNPNRWFVFSFTDTDLPGFTPQRLECDDNDHPEWRGRKDRDGAPATGRRSTSPARTARP